MPPLTPHLRAEIQIQPTESGVLVGDPVLRRRLDLGPIAPVLAAMDGRDAPAVVAACGPGADSVLRTLMLLNLLDGPGSATVQRMRALTSGEAPLQPVFLPESRFACQGSGGCCQNYVFGPLTDADVARVEANDLTPFGVTGPFYELRRRPDGRSERFLRTTPELRCVFLERGHRCGLHARYGGASKPGFCQLFPLTVQPTLDGLRVYDNGECASFSASARAGTPLAEQFPELQALVPDTLPLSHPLVHIHPGAVCDVGWFYPLQRAMVDRIGQAPAPETLRSLGRLLDAWRVALRTCPLVEGEPEASIEAVLRGEITAPAVAPAPGAIAGIAAELLEVFADAAAAPPFTREIRAALQAIASAAPLPPALPDEEALFQLSFRQHLFGNRALVDGRPMAALLRLAFDWLITRHGAHGDFDRGHLLATRRLDMPWAPLHRVFIRNEAATRGILEALAADVPTF